jgi:hypothetical protein
VSLRMKVESIRRMENAYLKIEGFLEVRVRN